MAAETLPELEPSKRLAVVNWVGLPPVQSCPSQQDSCEGQLWTSGSLTVLNWVGLPLVQSCPSQLSCCVQDALTIIALGDVQLALHCTEPVVCLKWVRPVREHRRVTPQELGTSIAGLRRWRRRRLSVSLLKSLNRVVQGGHHLHLELEVLLQSQRRRHRDPGPLSVLTLVVLTLLLARTGTGAPGVHHLI